MISEQDTVDGRTFAEGLFRLLRSTGVEVPLTANQEKSISKFSNQGVDVVFTRSDHLAIRLRFDAATNLITLARSISAIELRVAADFASPFGAWKSVPEPAASVCTEPDISFIVVVIIDPASAIIGD